MRFVQLSFEGAWLIVGDRSIDTRGEFRRIFNIKEFSAYGMDTDFKEIGLARNLVKGTFRGLHYQEAPYQQDKLVRVAKGWIADVVVDLRPDSKTYMKHEVVWLSDNLASMLYVPQGLAHGYLTMQNDTEVEYYMTGVHVPQAARGIRYNDPRFNIRLPAPVNAVLPRDLDYPDYGSVN